MNTNALVVLTVISKISYISANPEPNPSIFHYLIKRAAIMNRKCEEFEEEPITKRWKCVKFSSVQPKTKAGFNLHELNEEATVTSKSFPEDFTDHRKTRLEQEYELIIEAEFSKDHIKTWLEQEYELITEGLILEGLNCTSKSSEDFAY